jgi:integral membrane protein (TIGR01906 family)
MAEGSAVPGRHAPALINGLLALSMALVILLAGPLILFNPWFVSWEQARNDVPARLGTNQQQVDTVTGAMLCDLVLTCGDFDEGLGSGPLLTPDERAHMRDVSRLVRLLLAVLALAAVAAAISVVALRREPRRMGWVLIGTAFVMGSIALVVGLVFAVAFEQAFLLFHEVFFPQGNFLFGPDSNLLRLFPEGFWFEAALTAGGLIVVSAAVISAVGWRLLR